MNQCEPCRFTTKIATNWGYPAFSEPQRGEIGRTQSLVGKNPCLMLCFSVIRFFLKPIQWLKRVKSTTGSTALKVIRGLFRHSRIWIALVVSTFWGYTKAPAKRECCYDKPWDLWERNFQMFLGTWHSCENIAGLPPLKLLHSLLHDDLHVVRWVFFKCLYKCLAPDRKSVV